MLVTNKINIIRIYKQIKKKNKKSKIKVQFNNSIIINISRSNKMKKIKNKFLKNK